MGPPASPLAPSFRVLSRTCQLASQLSTFPQKIPHSQRKAKCDLLLTARDLTSSVFLTLIFHSTISLRGNSIFLTFFQMLLYSIRMST